MERISPICFIYYLMLENPDFLLKRSKVFFIRYQRTRTEELAAANQSRIFRNRLQLFQNSVKLDFKRY